MRRRAGAWEYVEVNSPDMMDESSGSNRAIGRNSARRCIIAETPDERIYCCKPMNCPGHVQIFKHG